MDNDRASPHLDLWGSDTHFKTKDNTAPKHSCVIEPTSYAFGASPADKERSSTSKVSLVTGKGQRLCSGLHQHCRLGNRIELIE